MGCAAQALVGGVWRAGRERPDRFGAGLAVAMRVAGPPTVRQAPAQYVRSANAPSTQSGAAAGTPQYSLVQPGAGAGAGAAGGKGPLLRNSSGVALPGVPPSAGSATLSAVAGQPAVSYPSLQPTLATAARGSASPARVRHPPVSWGSSSPTVSHRLGAMQPGAVVVAPGAAEPGSGAAGSAEIVTPRPAAGLADVTARVGGYQRSVSALHGRPGAQPDGQSGRSPSVIRHAERRSSSLVRTVGVGQEHARASSLVRTGHHEVVRQSSLVRPGHGSAAERASSLVRTGLAEESSPIIVRTVRPPPSQQGWHQQSVPSAVGRAEYPGTATPRPEGSSTPMRTSGMAATPTTPHVPARSYSPMRLQSRARSASSGPPAVRAASRTASVVPPRQPPVTQPLNLAVPPPLAVGETIAIGPHSFVLSGVLGEGTYAKVWSAQPATATGCLPPPQEGEIEEDKVAVKEMRCGRGPGILPDATLQRALFEVQVMKRLTAAGKVAAPEVLSHQVWPLGTSVPGGAFLCRVAMTRRRGRPLGEWLEARAGRNAHAESPWQSRGCACNGPAVAAHCGSFLTAVGVARRMLEQLAPTFGRLNGEIALHRDVNARRAPPPPTPTRAVGR